MIYGYLHQGSGIGNQLHRYIMTRIKASDLGVDYRMIYSDDFSGKPAGFKAKDFISFDESKIMEEPFGLETFIEKKVIENGIDIRSYDPEINFVKDNVIIEGEFQDSKYFEHRLNEINEWLKVEPIEIPDDVCVIGFRGGEYYAFPELGLPKDYFASGIEIMEKINPNMKFEVHTDDPVLARQFFPGYKIIQNAGINWRSMRHAKHAIIANSSFYIFPRLLSGGITIAPRGWARRNTQIWALPSNYYWQFTYI